MADPLTLLALAGMATSAIGRGVTGMRQQRDARRALSALENQEPTIAVPSAIRQRVLEPISQELLTKQQEEQARRTAESVGALQKAGARGIIGGLSSVMDAERAGERTRMAGLEQERRSALGQLGQAELDVQGRKMQNYLSKITAAQRALEAGQQNVMGALDTASNLGQQYIGGRILGLISPMKMNKSKSKPQETPFLNTNTGFTISEDMEEGVPLEMNKELARRLISSNAIKFL